MKLLRTALSEGHYFLDLKADNLETVFHLTLQHLVSRGLLATELRELVEQALLEREQLASTALGNEVAVPHAYVSAFQEPIIVFVRLARPLWLGAPDRIPTRYLFVLLGPTGFAGHLDTLMHVARLMADDEFRHDARVAQSCEELLAAFDEFLARTAQRAPRRPDVREGLAYTGRLFGGLLDDIRRRWPHYAGDLRDGLHPKCLSSTLFLFFACLAPAVTFGGIMADQTGGQIGAVEMIVASAGCGIVYALCSGQPLIILGGTGPLLVFTAILYRMCQDLGIPFFPTYAWVGMWSAVLLVILAATDASCLMRYFTRFTDEIFAALISFIFVYEAIKALVEVFTGHQVRYDTALLSLLLALGTFYIALSLSRFRQTPYLRAPLREFLADFGPTLSLVAMTLVAVRLNEVELHVLQVPQTLGTTTGRAWLVNPLAAPVWVWFAALIPAMLVAVLVFLDQNITARLVNSLDHRLQRGEAYHLDLALVGGLLGVCSLFGLPWLVAATVRSLNHLRSLATVEEVVTSHQERREKIVRVRENRMTGFAIHLAIGLSLLFLPRLRVIPMAVLYGLFLYMGVVSMRGNQFLQRLNLWTIDPALYPQTHFIRRVPLWPMYMYTNLQTACLAVLWLVKVSALGILFPLCIALLVPVRLLANRWFEPEHLMALDSETDAEEEQTQRVR